MIKSIDELVCRNCGLCEDICPMDVFRRKSGKVYIAYPGDCYNCMGCLYICPVEAIIFTPGLPQKFNSRLRWERIKAALNVRLTPEIGFLKTNATD